MSFPANTNTTATGGYLFPDPPTPLPGKLSFAEFLQTVLAGICGLPGELVREKWQIEPPKQPDVTVNWMAWALQENDADTFAYSGSDSDGNNVFMRMEELTVQTSFYGPAAQGYCELLRDGLQIGQNRAALASVNMGFKSTGKMVRAPDLVSERWVNRWEMSVYLRREILRTYPILSFLSVPGTLYSLQSNGVKTIALNSKG